MAPEAATGAWSTAVQFGAVGVICFLAVCGLIWFVISQKKDLKESNTKVISLLETTVKESTAALLEGAASKRELARSMEENASATRENTRMLKQVKCLDGGKLI